ncbi:MAG: rhomboid family intramembrane serine protease [Bacteroidota bacterium]
MLNSFLQEIKRFFLKGSVVARLIGINIAVFIIINLIGGLLYLFDSFEYYDSLANALSVPASFDSLISKPWTIITYMFLHINFFHILFNMIILYVGGRMFSDFIGKDRLIGTYILGGIIGAIFYVVSFNIFPVFRETLGLSVALGASASVLAIFIAVATYMPNFKIPLILLGPVKLKYIAIVFVGIDLISIHKGNAGGHIAHLGGAIWGFLYIKFLNAGIDPAKYVGNFISGIAALFKPKPRMKVYYESKSPRPESDDDYYKRKAAEQKNLDVILDKISKHGYDSLTKQEKELLFKFSKKQ